MHLIDLLLHLLLLPAINLLDIFYLLLKLAYLLIFSFHYFSNFPMIAFLLIIFPNLSMYHIDELILPFLYLFNNMNLFFSFSYNLFIGFSFLNYLSLPLLLLPLPMPFRFLQPNNLLLQIHILLPQLPHLTTQHPILQSTILNTIAQLANLSIQLQYLLVIHCQLVHFFFFTVLFLFVLLLPHLQYRVYSFSLLLLAWFLDF